MKVTELNEIIDNTLMEQVRGILMEQMENNSIEDSVRSFQTLSGLVDKISNVQTINDDKHSGVIISINDVTEDDLLSCCGGHSLVEAQKYLMQGLHHDLEDKGFGNNMDVEIGSETDDSFMNLQIKITTNKNEQPINEMKNTKECTKCGNKEITEKENLGLDMAKKKLPLPKNPRKEISEEEKINLGLDMAKKQVPINKTPRNVINKIGTNAKGGENLGVDMAKKQVPVTNTPRKETGKIGTNAKGGENLGLDMAKKQVPVNSVTRKVINKVGSTAKGGENLGLDMAKKKVPVTNTPRKEITEKEELVLGDNKDVKKKKVVKVTESRMIEMIRRIVNETALPGLTVTNKSHTESGTVNKANIADVTKKVKSYMSKEEFPHQNGGEKIARQNTAKEDETMEDNRGRGPQDLDYDNELPDSVKKNHKDAMTGTSKMGNPKKAGNAIDTKVGENEVKKVARKKEELAKEPLYKKEPVPTEKDSKPVRTVNEEKILQEEISRMKQMASYNHISQ
jgi:hypothetical protein